MSDKMSLGLFDKLRSFILIGAVFLGLFVGSFFLGFSQYSGLIVYVALIILLYSVMLGIPFGEIARSFKNIRFMGLSWIANFVIIPIIAWILALIFLKDNPAVFIGFILYLITPCTDWFLIFTSMAEGDVPLGLALMPTNLILQVVLIPVYLLLFAGKLIPFQFSAFIETVMVFIIFPFLLATTTRWVLRKIKGQEWTNTLFDTVLSPIQVFSLAIVIFAMFAGQTKIIVDNFNTLSLVFLPIIVFFILSFINAQIFSKGFNLSYKECALFTCTTAARNSPLSLAIAFGIFPNNPLIQVAIIIGVIIELPLLILVVKLLKVVKTTVYRERAEE